LELGRDVYEDMIAPFIAETLDAVHIALDGAGLTVSDLDEILLVGGATRTPLVQRRLEEALGMQPRGEVDPDLCVAAGAAIQAGVIAGQQVSNVLVDVTPYTFGTSAIAELRGALYPYTYIPLIRKNSPIPITKSDNFFTAEDGQSTILVHVYQGEDPDALNNTEIGSFRIEGLSDVPAGNEIITTFSLDLNGILHVTSREKRTGLEKRITIDNATARFEHEELAAARERLNALVGGEAISDLESDQAERREEVQAKALIEKAERLMERANPDDREDLVNLVEAVKDALAQSDATAMEAATSELSDLIYYLES
jgi:molecular chaperone DnaK (HSP70)